MTKDKEGSLKPDDDDFFKLPVSARDLEQATFKEADPKKDYWHFYFVQLAKSHIQQSKEILQLKAKLDTRHGVIDVKNETISKLTAEADSLREQVKALTDVAEALIKQVDNEHVSEYMDTVIDWSKAVLEKYKP